MAPPLVHAPFHREGWVYEEKIHGRRMLIQKDGTRVQILLRRSVEHTSPLPRHRRRRRQAAGATADSTGKMCSRHSSSRVP
jgi:ATP-dependent DNA ligase